jgi:hypothetical protein
VDPRLHYLQGKTKLVKSLEMLELLREFHADKGAMRQRHAAAAEFVGDYDFNNTYQYVIAREDMHLRWLADAVRDLGGGDVADAAAAQLHPSGKGAEAQRSVIAGDLTAAGEFIDKWRGRVDSLPNARNRTLLNVILGETLEHKRFFDLALAGRTDLLGRRADGAGTGGGVLPTRWVGDITK